VVTKFSVPAGSVQAYGLAICFVAAAGAVRLAIGLQSEDVIPYATFFPAVLFAALICGVGPGILAALSGGIIGWWAFLDPPMNWFRSSPGEQISLIAYLVTSLMIVWAGDHYRKLTKRLEDEEKFRELTVAELAHRLKNKVATIQSIVSLRLREDPQARDEILKCFDRLRATDDLIVAAQGRGARIGDILSAELRPYSGSRILIEGPQILLAPKLALTMALLLHELATNAAKYGALSSFDGKISVRWSHSDDQLKLEWRESDGPPVKTPDHRGFGTRLFLRALAQFGGKIETTFASTGLVCELSVPLSDVASAPVAPTAPALQPIE
jgi:two-component sensor histidine kinase